MIGQEVRGAEARSKGVRGAEARRGAEATLVVRGSRGDTSSERS
jgi:hypothetical protein